MDVVIWEQDHYADRWGRWRDTGYVCVGLGVDPVYLTAKARPAIGPHKAILNADETRHSVMDTVLGIRQSLQLQTTTRVFLESS